MTAAEKKEAWKKERRELVNEIAEKIFAPSPL